jgi:hypothetical protein
MKRKILAVLLAVTVLGPGPVFAGCLCESGDCEGGLSRPGVEDHSISTCHRSLPGMGLRTRGEAKCSCHGKVAAFTGSAAVSGHRPEPIPGKGYLSDALLSSPRSAHEDGYARSRFRGASPGELILSMLQTSLDFRGPPAG